MARVSTFHRTEESCGFLRQHIMDVHLYPCYKCSPRPQLFEEMKLWYTKQTANITNRFLLNITVYCMIIGNQKTFAFTKFCEFVVVSENALFDQIITATGRIEYRIQFDRGKD